MEATAKLLERLERYIEKRRSAHDRLSGKDVSILVLREKHYDNYDYVPTFNDLMIALAVAFHSRKKAGWYDCLYDEEEEQVYALLEESFSLTLCYYFMELRSDGEYEGWHIEYAGSPEDNRRILERQLEGNQ